MFAASELTFTPRSVSFDFSSLTYQIIVMSCTKALLVNSIKKIIISIFSIENIENNFVNNSFEIFKVSFG